jgi:hypothetical protein
VSSTDFGEALIKSYRELERDLATLVARNFHTSITTVMRRHSKSGARASVRGSLEQAPPIATGVTKSIGDHRVLLGISAIAADRPGSVGWQLDSERFCDL